MQLEEIKEYYPNGQLWCHYYEDENDLAQGECKNYYENGQLWNHCHYKDGKWNGKYTVYKEDGSIDFIEWYSNGVDVTDKKIKLDNGKNYAVKRD